jgi:LPS O-antigen subunit length determinant protein (WzzB/FepE family)
MEDEIDLSDIFRALWKNRILIGGIFIISILVAGAIAFTTPSIYKVSTIVAMGNFSDPVYTSPVSAKSIMLSDEFLLDLFNQLHSNATAGEFDAFKSGIKVVPVGDSDRLVEISDETTDPHEGKKAVETMVLFYANRSNESYNEQRNILSRQLRATEERLDTMNIQINLTRDALMNIEDSSSSSAVQSEMRFSRTLDRLSDMETQRSDLIERIQDLQTHLDLLKLLVIVQPAREPVSPIGPRKASILATAGVLGLVLGIFAAFLREGLARRSE